MQTDANIAELQGKVIVATAIKDRLAELERYEYKPHPGQIEFHKSTALIRCLFTGNRFGKSYAMVREFDMWCSHTHRWRETPKEPVRTRLVGDGYEHGVEKILLPIIKACANPMYLKGGTWNQAYQHGKHTLTYKDGSVLELMSYKLGDLGRGAQMFAGVDLDLYGQDEHGPYAVWAENQARIGSRSLNSIISLTPVLGKTWEHDELYEPWQTGLRLDVECFMGDMADNPHLSSEARDAYLSSVRDPNMKEVRSKGVWINLGGDVYAMWNPDVHFVPYEQGRVDECTKTVIIDPHPSKPTAVLWCGIGRDNRSFAYREYRERKQIREIADDIRRLSGQEDIRRFLIDPQWGWTNNETGKSVHDTFRENGIPVEPAYRGPDNVLYERMRAALEISPTVRRGNFEVMRSCERLKWEFEHNKFKPQTDAMKESDRWKRIKEDDDLLICAEYYLQDNPVYLGRKRVKARGPVLSPTQAGMV